MPESDVAPPRKTGTECVRSRLSDGALQSRHTPQTMRGLALCAIFALAILSITSPARAQNGCGSLQTHYGPFDYRVNRDKLPVVENRHFTPAIAGLLRGVTATTPGPDIEYTLGAFPNHAPALASLMKWAQLNRTGHPKDLRYSVDCHFDRALRWRADDVVVRMLFAQWLGETGRKEDALRQLSLVEADQNPLTIYNLGLLYLQFGEMDQALRLAHETRRLGFGAPALEQRLREAGRWREPENQNLTGPELATPSAADPASAAASAAD